MKTHCKAMQYSDQMVCQYCDLIWDVNDLHPPACKSDKTVLDMIMSDYYKFIEHNGTKTDFVFYMGQLERKSLSLLPHIKTDTAETSFMGKTVYFVEARSHFRIVEL